MPFVLCNIAIDHQCVDFRKEGCFPGLSKITCVLSPGRNMSFFSLTPTRCYKSKDSKIQYFFIKQTPSKVIIKRRLQPLHRNRRHQLTLTIYSGTFAGPVADNIDESTFQSHPRHSRRHPEHSSERAVRVRGASDSSPWWWFMIAVWVTTKASRRVRVGEFSHLILRPLFIQCDTTT